MVNKKKNKAGFHPKSLHNTTYDFSLLVKANPAFKPWPFINKYGKETIDFGNPGAVKSLNQSLLMAYYNIKYWDFPDENLCPPIPSRADYIHHLADLLKDVGIHSSVRILDIGTGANAIYPLLGNALYGWNFVVTDIDPDSLANAKKIFKKNHLEEQLTIYFQPNKEEIFKGVFKESERFSASMCNPPFFKSAEELEKSHQRKLKGLGRLGTTTGRNFGGKNHELVFRGGEKAFLHNYLYESSLHKKQCFWYTILVSKKENLKSMKTSLEKLQATVIKTIPLQHGNKVSRIMAWTFLNEKEQSQWMKE